MVAPLTASPSQTRPRPPSAVKTESAPEDWTRKDVLRLRGRLLAKTHRGRVVVQKWPRRRGRNQSQLQKAWTDAFSDRARNLKAPSGRQLTAASDLARGSGWYYRDVLETAAYGKLITDGDEYRVTTPTCAFFQPTSAVIPQNVSTPLETAMQYWDNNAFRDPANLTRAVCKSAGLYLITAVVNWTTLVGTTAHQQRLRVNGTTVVAEIDTPGTTTLPYRQNLQAIWYFHANDYVEVCVQKNNLNNQVRLDLFQLVGITPEALIP